MKDDFFSISLFYIFTYRLLVKLVIAILKKLILNHAKYLSQYSARQKKKITAKFFIKSTPYSIRSIISFEQFF